MKFDICLQIWHLPYLGTLGCYLVHMYGWAVPASLTLWSYATVLHRFCVMRLWFL